jgi:hypothetical protein
MLLAKNCNPIPQVLENENYKVHDFFLKIPIAKMVNT